MAATSASLAHSSGDKGKHKSGASSALSDRAKSKQDGGGSRAAGSKQATLATKAVLAKPTSLVTVQRVVEELDGKLATLEDEEGGRQGQGRKQQP